MRGEEVGLVGFLVGVDFEQSDGGWAVFQTDRVQGENAGFQRHRGFDFFAQQGGVGFKVIRVDFEFRDADEGCGHDCCLAKLN